MTQFFHRPTLAANLAQRLLQPSVSASASGLFLFAQRRVGKTTFLREDLKPALQKAGALVLHVDLWADQQVDPGTAIVTTVREEVGKYAGVLQKLVAAAGVDNVALGGVSFSVDRIGLGADVSLSRALAALSDEVRQPIVLIVDEAQHAVTTDDGMKALHALKAARDLLNSSVHHGLRIVATGSNRAKLAMLRNSKDQAFFGAPMMQFPALDASFVQWFCQKAGPEFALHPTRVHASFERAGFRPEFLFSALETLKFDLEAHQGNATDKLQVLVDELVDSASADVQRAINALTPLQSAVLRTLVATRADYKPFDASTIELYQAVLRSIAPSSELIVDVANVQQALNALQAKGFVWKERRGVYDVEDSATIEVMSALGMLDPVVAWMAEQQNAECRGQQGDDAPENRPTP